MSAKCPTHPTKNVEYICTKEDCQKLLCETCQKNHKHPWQKILSLDTLEWKTMDVIEKDLTGKFKAKLKTLLKSGESKGLFTQTLMNLHPYFVTGNFDGEEMIDYLSNYLEVKFFDQTSQRISTDLKKELKPIFQEKTENPDRVSFKEKFLISGQYYYDYQDTDHFRSKGKTAQKDKHDWSLAKVKSLLGQDPFFAFTNEFHVQKLQGENEIIFWNKSFRAICVFTADGSQRKFYQVPKETQSLAFMKVSGSFYVVIQTKKSIQVANLERDAGKEVKLKLFVKDHARSENDESSDSDEEEEKESHKDEEEEKDDDDEEGDEDDEEEEEKKIKKSEKQIKLTSLQFTQIKEVKNITVMKSDQNKILLVDKLFQAELFEVTQAQDNNSLVLVSLGLTKFASEPTDVLADFSRNFVFAKLGNELQIHQIKPDQCEVIYTKKGVKEFQWNQESQMLFLNSKFLHQLTSQGFRLMRTFKPLDSPILTKKGILFEREEKLNFIPYWSAKDPTEISLPDDKAAIKKADEIGQRLPKGYSDDTDFHPKPGRAKGYVIEDLKFLNAKDENLIFVRSSNLFTRKIEYDYWEDGCLTKEDQRCVLETEVETYRIFEVDWKI